MGERSGLTLTFDSVLKQIKKQYNYWFNMII